MTLRLMGANPCVTLYDAGEAIAYASIWRVDWSLRGPGRALVLGKPGRIGSLVRTSSSGRGSALSSIAISAA
ncbi:hypothetical protein [Devosia sp. A16]|uniref:hypothetical protein n=1 Tax=Devosia sp. A16 TaxID=1736675 RepID=UPI000A5E19BC|nr:hypothetical protein [Devosia sp. A16]